MSAQVITRPTAQTDMDTLARLREHLDRLDSLSAVILEHCEPAARRLGADDLAVALAQFRMGAIDVSLILGRTLGR